MPNKSVVALSALATLVCATWSTQAAPAEQPVSSSRSGNYPQAAACHSQYFTSSDFVAVPYTFGSRLDYRPVVVDQETPCPVADALQPNGRETTGDGSDSE